MSDKKYHSKAMQIAVSISGVECVAITGESKNEIVVIGEGIDAAKLASLLRKSVGFADILSVGDIEFHADGQRIVLADDTNVAQGRQLQPTGWGNNYYGSRLDEARSLAEPPTLTELLQAKIRNDEKESGLEKETGMKRKLDSDESDNSSVEEEGSNCNKLKKAKNLAVSMAKKAAAMARELKSMKSDLCFVQERCALLEEENTRLRDGFSSGIRPEEDDLMRLQMETLLAEKSRLANENANLSRENQTLNQLVEYHQLSSQDLSESYEQLVQGIGLNFSSPDCIQDKQINNADDDHEAGGSPAPHPSSSIAELSTSLDKYFEEEQ
ncbi:Disease resistance protein Pik-1 [Linum perenne]